MTWKGREGAPRAVGGIAGITKKGVIKIIIMKIETVVCDCKSLQLIVLATPSHGVGCEGRGRETAGKSGIARSGEVEESS